MAANQFRDLPQIPHGMGDPRYATWGVESYNYMDPYKQDHVSFRPDDEMYFEGFDNGLMSMQPMERFMQDQYPLTQGVLHANVPLQRQLRTQYEPQWPSADCFRNISPDRTSASDNSSYDLHSPHVYHAVPFGNHTDDCSSLSMAYPSTEHLKEDGYPLHPSLMGGSISLRELEYEHPEPEQEPEIIMENTEDVVAKQESVCDHECTAIEAEAVTPDNSKGYADSGIGNSVRDAESVQPMDVQEAQETQEVQEIQDLPDDPASDSDYSPTSSGRSSKRRRSSASNSSPSRISKRTGSSVSKSSSASKASKKTRRVSILTKNHNDVDDERRPFPCPFANYGCGSTFSSKNEWKRHVSTQHVKLGFWRCDLCPPSADAKDDQVVYYNDFNRKDLFTQHLRRMHAAPKHESSRSQNEYPVNEDNLGDHQTRCLLSLRRPPQHSICLFCDKTFHGPTSWEERMEHIGRHLEKDGKGGNMLNVKSWNKDEGLEQYLVDEGLIVMKQSSWMIGDGKPVRTDCAGDDDSSEE
jgi:hypothetical protein